MNKDTTCYVIVARYANDETVKACTIAEVVNDEKGAEFYVTEDQAWDSLAVLHERRADVLRREYQQMLSRITDTKAKAALIRDADKARTTT